MSKGELLKKLIEIGNLWQLKLLMKSSADFEVKDKEGNTPLINAVMTGKEEIVKFLVESGANLEATDSNGSTPLMWACCKSNLAIAEYLLEKGARINSKNLEGKTPILYAMSNLQILELLFTYGVDLYQLNEKGQTLLHLAAELNQLGAVSYFISKGLDINARDNQGFPALYYAHQVGNKEMAQILLEKDSKGAHLDKEERLPLDNASKAELLKKLIEQGDLLQVQSLMQSSDDFKIKDKEGNTSLINAVTAEKKKIVEFLVESGADLEATDNNGSTPLMWACCKSNLAIAEYLLKKGARVDAKNSRGFTALHYACHAGSKEIAHILLEKDPDGIYTRITGEKAKHRPIDVALWVGKRSAAVVELLLSFEKNPLFPGFLLKERLLCHKFSTSCSYITEDNQKVEFESLSLELAYEELQRSLSNYISRHESDLPKELDWQKVLEVFSKSLSNRKNVSYCLSDTYPFDIISLPAGWSGHGTGVVVSKKHQILIKCDRTFLSPGLTVYKIGKMDKVEEALQKVVKNRELAEGKDYFCTEIDKELDLNFLAYLPHVSQTVGNCAWKSSAVLVLRGIIYLTLLEEGFSYEEADKLSSIDYKAWDEEDRHMSIQKFLDDLEQLQESLKANPISAEKLEQEGIIPGQILPKVFIKCIREQRLDSLKLLLEKCSELLQIKWVKQSIADRKSIYKSFKQALKWNDLELACWLATQVIDGPERHSLFGEIIKHFSSSSNEPKKHISLPDNFLEKTVPYFELFKAISHKDAEKAEAIASSLSNQSDRDFALAKAVELRLSQKEETRALDISLTMENQNYRDETIRQVVKFFESTTGVDKLVDIANSQLGSLHREWVLESIVYYFILKENLKEAREISSFLPQEKPEVKYLLSIMEVLEKNTKKALELFKSIPEESRKESSKNQLIAKLIHAKEEYSAACEFASLLNKKAKSEILKDVVSSLLNKNRYQEALDIAHTIPSRWKQSHAYEYLVEYMVCRQWDSEEVEKIINLIPKEAVRETARNFGIKEVDLQFSKFAVRE